MTASLHLTGETPYGVTETLLGHNIEVASDVVAGLLSERLDNPTFFGPGNPQNHVADGWQPCWHYRSPTVRFDLVQGMAVSGWQSQLIHKFGDREGGICQNNRFVRKGETLKITLWARAEHGPVTLRVGLRPLQSDVPPDYAIADIRIDACYWKPYETTLTVDADDNEAVFYCVLPERGLVYLDQIHLHGVHDGHLRADVVEAIAAMGIGTLRFPGGHMSAGYHWRHGIGPLHQRPHLPDIQFRFPQGLRYDFGTDEYLALCRDLRITPLITVNVATDTPESAGEWAAYCRQWWRDQGLEPPMAYWKIGCEANLNSELGNSTPEMYVETVRAFSPLIRAAYPGARIVILGPDGCSNLDAGWKPWRCVVLDQTPPELYDIVDAHIYATVPKHLAGAERCAALVAAAEKIRRYADAADADVRTRHLDKTISMAEWNLSQMARHHDGKGYFERYDTEHALFTAMMLNHWVRMGARLELANFYHLLNARGLLIARGPVFKQTCVVDVFKLYRPAFPGEALPVRIDGPRIAVGETVAHAAATEVHGGEILPSASPGQTDGPPPALDAICLRNRDAAWLLLVNRDLRAHDASLPEGLGSIVETVILSGKDFTDETLTTTTAGPSTDLTITLPPLCIARVRLG